MTTYDTTWYCNYGNGSSTGYYAVPVWAASTAYTVGQMCRQLATPSIGNERVFACIGAGTSGGSEPTWVLTYGAKTTDNTVTWMEVTGRAGVNGDTTNANTWTSVKNKAVVFGQIVYDSVTASIQIVTTAGTTGNGSQPTFSATAGTTTADNTATWTSLGLSSGFTAWGAPHARVQTLTATSGFINSGNTVYTANTHNQVDGASITFAATPNGSTQNILPCNFISVNPAAAPPTAALAGASISTTGANGISLNAPSNCYFYGFNFTAGSGSNVASITLGNGSVIWDTCNFTLGNTATTSVINVSATTLDQSNGVYKNCGFVFGNASQSMSLQNSCFGTFQSCTFAATGTAPTSLFTGTVFTGRVAGVKVKDSDMSNVTGTLVNFNGVNTVNCGIFSVENCKVNSSVVYAVLQSNAAYNLGPIVRFHTVDGSSTNYRYAYYTTTGTILSETTVVRTGGASNGTTGLSWNIATGSLNSFTLPFATEEIAAWNDNSGSAKTATIYLTSNSTLTNADVWVEIEYLSSSSAPLGAIVTTKASLLASGATLTTDSSTWGGSITNKYKISATFTPQLKGPVKARIYVAKPSATIYVDPLLVIA